MNLKPLTEYTCDDIRNLPDDEFVALMLIAGPFPEPIHGYVYLPDSDWRRLIGLFGPRSGEDGGICGVFMRRVRRKENDLVSRPAG